MLASFVIQNHRFHRHAGTKNRMRVPDSPRGRPVDDMIGAAFPAEITAGQAHSNQPLDRDDVQFSQLSRRGSPANTDNRPPPPTYNYLVARGEIDPQPGEVAHGASTAVASSARPGQRQHPSTAAARFDADVQQAPAIRHPNREEIRTAQRILRQIPDDADRHSAYGTLVAEAESAGMLPLENYVDQRGDSTELAKRIKRGERVDGLRDHAIRLGARSALVLTAGTAVVVTPLGHAYRNAGERLARPPDNAFTGLRFDNRHPSRTGAPGVLRRT
jgi:hypothetical protein